MPDLDPQYWRERYRSANTPWDIGYASPPLIRYAEQLPPASRILLPGAGHAYEAVYLHRAGYTQVYVCDWAEEAFDHLRREAPDFPADRQLVGDFFALTGQYDCLLEQTFFCALDPRQRPDYVRQAHRLLSPHGRLAGLLFADHFPNPGPPFGGTRAEYEALFSPYFHIHRLEIADSSIKPRAGREFFVEMQPK